ncbi:hypothetical protein [Streptomyces spinosirectus]
MTTHTPAPCPTRVAFPGPGTTAVLTVTGEDAGTFGTAAVVRLGGRPAESPAPGSGGAR